MNKSMKRVIQILEEEEAQYQKLLSAMEREHAALVDSDMELMDTVTIEKEKILSKLKTLETERLEVVEDLSRLVHVPTHELTLTTLSKLSNEPYRTSLKELNKKL